MFYSDFFLHVRVRPGKEQAEKTFSLLCSGLPEYARIYAKSSKVHIDSDMRDSAESILECYHAGDLFSDHRRV